MMNSSINERIKDLKKEGYKITKLMAYDEGDYDRIMEIVKATYSGATFVAEAEPAVHLPYTKGGLKFSLLGYKSSEEDYTVDLVVGRKVSLADQNLGFEDDFPNSKRAFLKCCPTGGEATLAIGSIVFDVIHTTTTADVARSSFSIPASVLPQSIGSERSARSETTALTLTCHLRVSSGPVL